MTEDDVARTRLRLLPPIRRSRLWRLYAEERPGGPPSRFLDFWMDGGKSLLGAKGTGLGTIAKAAIDTGLTRPFPSIREARLTKELLSRHPAYAAVRLYGNEERAMSAALALLPAGQGPRVLYPLDRYSKGGEAPAGAAGSSTPRIDLLRLPCPAILAPGVLLFEDEEAALAAPGELLPPLLLACAHRSLLELDRFLVDYGGGPVEEGRIGGLSPYFERSGPFLYARAGAEAYDRLFATALGAGVLLSPYNSLPSIIPGDFDDGELARPREGAVGAVEPRPERRGSALLPRPGIFHELDLQAIGVQHVDEFDHGIGLMRARLDLHRFFLEQLHKPIDGLDLEAYGYVLPELPLGLDRIVYQLDLGLARSQKGDLHARIRLHRPIHG